MTNPYGDGHASERIVQVLTSVPFGERLLTKRALPLREGRFADAEAAGE
jgi:hypothetical protein